MIFDVFEPIKEKRRQRYRYNRDIHVVYTGFTWQHLIRTLRKCPRAWQVLYRTPGVFGMTSPAWERLIGWPRGARPCPSLAFLAGDTSLPPPAEGRMWKKTRKSCAVLKGKRHTHARTWITLELRYLYESSIGVNWTVFRQSMTLCMAFN